MTSPKSPLAAAAATATPSAATSRDARPAEAARALHDRMANAIRALAMDAVEQAKSGHPGLPMGAADVATVLFTRFLKFDPADPAWPDRDRFVLSAGHGSMLIYAVLHLLGYEAMTLDEIKRFRQIGSLTPGHPENFITPGVETTTGPLGQGLATAVGMAIAERHLAATFGKDIVDHSTFVLASDGDLMEGLSHEAISLAGHLRLNRLIVLWDDNHVSIDGPTSLAVSDDQIARFRASGWRASAIDGHDPAAIAAALAAAQDADRPTLIACRTIIGFGAPKKQGTSATHGSPLGANEIKGAREKLGWSYPPFEVPADISDEWRKAGTRSLPAHAAWTHRLKAMTADTSSADARRSIMATSRRFRATFDQQPSKIHSRALSRVRQRWAPPTAVLAKLKQLGGKSVFTPRVGEAGRRDSRSASPRSARAVADNRRPPRRGSTDAPPAPRQRRARAREGFSARAGRPMRDRRRSR